MSLWTMVTDLFTGKGSIGTSGVLMGFLSLSGLVSGVVWLWDWLIGRFTVSVTVTRASFTP